MRIRTLFRKQLNPEVRFSGPAELVPVYATDGAAGADLKAHLDAAIVIKPGERILVPTGIRMAIPRGWEGQVRPRSGLALKKGLTLLNSPGTIDADYRGEVKVLLINLGEKSIQIEPGERIAQLVINRIIRAVFTRHNRLPASRRNSGGFGSTGR